MWICVIAHMYDTVPTTQAKQLDIHDVQPFFRSKIFSENRYEFDTGRRQIVKTL